jgi:hypothetical protein
MTLRPNSRALLVASAAVALGAFFFLEILEDFISASRRFAASAVGKCRKGVVGTNAPVGAISVAANKAIQ